METLVGCATIIVIDGPTGNDRHFLELLFDVGCIRLVPGNDQDIKWDEVQLIPRISIHCVGLGYTVCEG